MFWTILSYTSVCSVWKLRFQHAKSGPCIAAPASSHHMLRLTRCCFSLTTSSTPTTTCAKLSVGWLVCATAAATHPEALMLTFNLLSTMLKLPLFVPQCRWWLCHCSWDQSAAGAHWNDHMEPTCHLQELLWNYCAAFPLWPPELQYEAGHLDLRWKLGQSQSCNSTQNTSLKEQFYIFAIMNIVILAES